MVNIKKYAYGMLVDKVVLVFSNVYLQFSVMLFLWRRSKPEKIKE